MPQQFIELTTGGIIPPNSMDKSRACVLMQKLSCDELETTAETLLRLLEDSDDMLFVICTGSFDEASNLVKIHKKRKNPLKKLTPFLWKFEMMKPNPTLSL